MEKKLFFFLKLDHIFSIENPKKLLLDKQIFAFSDAKFCRDTRNNGRYTQNFVTNLRNFKLDLSP